MSEKEADEYATENWEYYEEGKNDSKELKQAYLAGAELGYNKAFVETDKNLKAIVTDFNKAKEIIRDLLQVLPKENIEGIYEITEEAEQFLRENE